MRSSKSPFKKLSHSREGSTDDRSSPFHKRSISGSSMTMVHHTRNVSGSGTNSAPPVSGIKNNHRRTTSNSSRSSQNSNFLAEQYERDRKAIISSCFSTDDTRTSGAPNSYITHVRIIEDTKSPSSRPPQDSKLENKKKRILIISAKPTSAGASPIQLHKGRENSDGSFQIGRTWDLKDLTRIERDTEVSEGFILTMSKKYYWETNSAKERTVFIKSLINTFMQAFDGHVPELVSWDLSMFYLDERSYQRALISRSPSSSRATTTANIPMANSRNSDHSMGRPAAKSSEQIRASNHTAKVTSASAAPLASLKKAPYSNSPTIIEANKRDDSQQHTQRQDQGRPTMGRKYSQPPISVASTGSGASSQRSSKFTPQPSGLPKQFTPPAVVTPAGQQHLMTQAGENAFDVDEYSSPKRMTPSESRSDHLLEDLNNVLGSSNHGSSEEILTGIVSPPSVAEPPLEKKPISDEELTPVTVAKVESITVDDIYEPKSFDDKSLDLNDTISDEDPKLDEETNELSFERGDEVRYSQVLEPETAHMYHEVSTIQEENVVVAAFKEEEKSLTELEKDIKGGNKANERSKKTWNINDEELLEILTDINWEVDDDADKLLERLNIKMAETEYIFNRSLLSLEKLGSSLLSYEDNIEKECDKMNPILSLFLMEMSNVAEDIEYVESQKNGLQVESANKKLLWSTLTELLNTVSLDEASLNELLNYAITEKNLPGMEIQLKTLFKALKAINGEEDEEHYNLGEMKALKQRRETYEKVTKIFIERLVQEMVGKFVNISKDQISEDRLFSFLTRLLKYSSLTLFCKDISPESYHHLIEKWNTSIAGVYNKMSDSILTQLDTMREEFLIRERRSLNDQPGLGNLLSQWKNSRIDKSVTAKTSAPRQLVRNLREQVETIGRWCIFYQNFIDNFFHISSKLDFEQYVKQYGDPDSRIIPLHEVGGMQSDRDSAATEVQLVSRIFQPILSKVTASLMEVLKCDRSIAPALMISLEQNTKVLDSSNAEFLLAAISRISSQVKQLWAEYIDDQVIYLERLTINVSSRCLLPSAISLPLFIKSSQDLIMETENDLSLKDDSSFETVVTYEAACSKLSDAVTKLLTRKKGSNDIPTTTESSSLESTNLDRTITLLMNCHWLLEIMNMLNSKNIFDASLQTAKKMFDLEKENYASYLLRDAMPKLTSFVNGACNLIVSTAPGRVVDPSKWAAYSKHNLENILVGYTSREIDILVKRLHEHMLAHFANEPDEVMKEVLCDKLWSCIQGQTVSLYLKLYTLIEKHYKGTYVKFTKNDIITAFEGYKKSGSF